MPTTIVGTHCHARNLKLLDQKSGSAMEKSGSPDQNLHIVRFHAVTVDVGSHHISPERNTARQLRARLLLFMRAGRAESNSKEPSARRRVTDRYQTRLAEKSQGASILTIHQVLSLTFNRENL